MPLSLQSREASNTCSLCSKNALPLAHHRLPCPPSHLNHVHSVPLAQYRVCRSAAWAPRDWAVARCFSRSKSRPNGRPHATTDSKCLRVLLVDGRGRISDDVWFWFILYILSRLLLSATKARLNPCTNLQKKFTRGMKIFSGICCRHYCRACMGIAMSKNIEFIHKIGSLPLILFHRFHKGRMYPHEVCASDAISSFETKYWD